MKKFERKTVGKTKPEKAVNIHDEFVRAVLDSADIAVYGQDTFTNEERVDD